MTPDEAVKVLLDNFGAPMGTRLREAQDMAVAALRRAPAVTGEADSVTVTRAQLASIAWDRFDRCPVCRGQRPRLGDSMFAEVKNRDHQSGCWIAAALAAPPAAGAPPALVALVQEYQTAHAADSGIADDHDVERYGRLVRAHAALLAWSPAPAPVAVVGVDWASEPDRSVGVPAPVAPPACGCGPSDVCRDDGCQCACHRLAPPAVAGGDAPPEIQVGDWYQFLDCDVAEVIDERWLPIVRAHLAADELTELRGERDGQPFIWRRRQEGQ